VRQSSISSPVSECDNSPCRPWQWINSSPSADAASATASAMGQHGFQWARGAVPITCQPMRPLTPNRNTTSRVFGLAWVVDRSAPWREARTEHSGAGSVRPQNDSYPPSAFFSGRALSALKCTASSAAPADPAAGASASTGGLLSLRPAGRPVEAGRWHCSARSVDPGAQIRRFWITAPFRSRAGACVGGVNARARGRAAGEPGGYGHAGLAMPATAKPVSMRGR